MHLDKGDPHGQQRITKRDARVREARGIEDDESDMTRGRLVDAGDQLGLGVALEGGDPVTCFRRQLRHPLVYLFEGDVPIQPGLAYTQEVEVGTVEQQYVSHEPPEDIVKWRQV